LSKSKKSKLIEALDPLPGHKVKLQELFIKIETVTFPYFIIIALSASERKNDA